MSVFCNSRTWSQSLIAYNSAEILNTFNKSLNLSARGIIFEFILNELRVTSSHTKTRNVHLLHCGTIFTMQASCIINNEVLSNASFSPGFNKFTGQTSIYCFCPFLHQNKILFYNSNFIKIRIYLFLSLLSLWKFRQMHKFFFIRNTSPSILTYSIGSKILVECRGKTSSANAVVTYVDSTL